MGLFDFVEDIFGGGDEGGVQTTSTLNKEQEELMKQLLPYLQSKIGKGLPAYEGPFAARPSTQEQQGLDLLSKYISGGVNEVEQAGLDTFMSALRGMSPEETFDFYSKYIAPQEQQYMQREIIPQIREEYGTTGNIKGSPRFEAVGKAWEQFGAGQLGRIGDLIQTERARSAAVLPYTTEFSNLVSGLPQIEAAFQYGTLPRLIEQTEIAGKLEEFRRTTPELNPIIDKALSALGITTTASYYQEPSGGLADLISVASDVMGMFGGKKTTSNQQDKKSGTQEAMDTAKTVASLAALFV